MPQFWSRRGRVLLGEIAAEVDAGIDVEAPREPQERPELTGVSRVAGVVPVASEMLEDWSAVSAQVARDLGEALRRVGPLWMNIAEEISSGMLDSNAAVAHDDGMPTTTRTARLAARYEIEDRALALREQGMTYAQIATELGIYAQIANTHVRRALARRAMVGHRAFGVEIELKGLSPAQAAMAIRAAGLTAYDESYNHSDRPHWKVVLDGSVSGGCEVVSPVLSGQDGLTQVETVMTALRDAGGTVDVSCGLHVHVDARDLTGDQFARVFGFYTERQPLFDQLVAPSRRRNQYCRPYRSDEIDDIKGQAVRNDKQVYWSDRYRTVNVCSFGRHGTIEFRQHQGTLSGTKTTAWVKLLLAIVAKVEATEEEAISGTDVALMIDSLGLPADTATYLKGRAERLG